MKRLYFHAILALVFSACNDNSLIIDDTSVGPLMQTTRVFELPQLFPGDSLAGRRIEGDSLTGEVELYDAQGKMRMIIFPKDETAPTSELSYARIIDPNFTTKN